MTGRWPERRRLTSMRHTVNLRPRIMLATDRVMAAAVVALVFGSAVCFGGAVWWFRPAVAVVTFVLVGAKLAQHLLNGRVPVLKSPLFLLGLLALALGLLQLVPFPPPWRASSRRPRTRFIPWEPCRRWPEPTCLGPARRAGGGSLAGDARPCGDIALAGGGGRCAWGFSGRSTHFADRLGRLYLVWGCVVAAFVLNAALGLVQIVGQAEGMYGFIQPGRAPVWAPSAGRFARGPRDGGLAQAGASCHRDRGRDTTLSSGSRWSPNGRICSGP